MEMEKKSSKSGFLSFFEWGGKSRKKLFPNNNGGELSTDGIKKVKENLEEHVPRFQLVEYDQNRANFTSKGIGEFNCGSSVSSDDGFRTGAPSVVARLMGLDTMPSVNVNDISSAQISDSRSLRNGCVPGNSLKSRIDGFDTNYQNYSYNQDGFSRGPVIMTPLKMPGRPIEKFQTEMLPPRSVKTIPITHHKLLSPIKSPRFIPTKNAAYIMEAASRIIDSNPRTAINGRTTLHASSSVPLRIRDLKERMEASQKSLRPQKPRENGMISSVNLKETKLLNGSVAVPKMKAPVNSGRSSSGILTSRGKVGLRTELVKSDIQRRGGSVSSSINNLTNRQVYNDAVSKQAVRRSQQGIQRSDQPKVATVRAPSVLRQNNQKQNNTQSGNSSVSNSSVSNQIVKKSTPPSGSVRINKTARRSATDDQTKSRKDVMVAENGKHYPMSKVVNSRQQKRSKKGTNISEDMRSDTVLVSKDGKSIQCNAVIDGSSSWALGNNKDGMDVISFTFSSPLKKPEAKSDNAMRAMGGAQPTAEGSHYSQLHNTNLLTLSPQKFNGIGSDALGILLEQKLRGLTCKIDSSSCSSSDKKNNSSQFCRVSENSDSITEPECPSDDFFHAANRGAQDIEDAHSVNKKNDPIEKFGVKHMSVPYADDSLLDEGCCLSSENSCSIQDSKGFSDVTSFEVADALYAESYSQAECEVDSLDASNMKLVKQYSYPLQSGWESQYVREVIGQAALRVNHYLLGQVDDVIDSNLFDELEIEPSWSESEAYSDSSNNKLERKLLFDCISELMNRRCQQLTTGFCRSWSKWGTLSHQTELFSQELCREISGLKNMDELMVDDVVDKDMSSGQGRWVSFEMQASEECAEMENLLLSSLVDEVVTDMLY